MKKLTLHRFPSHGGFPIGKIKNHLKQNPERVKSSSIATGKLAIQFEYMIIYAPVVFFREIGDAWRRQRNVPEGLLSNKC
jgi:hypothetical protein